MSKHSVYSIGRSKDVDLRLEDDSVSRLHGEITQTADGRYYFTDCASSGGSYVLRDGQWQALRQAFVDKTDSLRLGQFHISVQELALLIREFRQGRSSKPGSGPDWTSKEDLPSGPVKRNSSTGEIIGEDKA